MAGFLMTHDHLLLCGGCYKDFRNGLEMAQWLEAGCFSKRPQFNLQYPHKANTTCNSSSRDPSALFRPSCSSGLSSQCGQWLMEHIQNIPTITTQGWLSSRYQQAVTQFSCVKVKSGHHLGHSELHSSHRKTHLHWNITSQCIIIMATEDGQQKPLCMIFFVYLL